MEELGQYRTLRSLPPDLSILASGESPATLRPDTLGRTRKQCLLETQRQVHRLEQIVLRLSTAATRTTTPSVGALSQIQESNRRLEEEVDEFSLDSHAFCRLFASEASRSSARWHTSGVDFDHHTPGWGQPSSVFQQRPATAELIGAPESRRYDHTR